MGAAVGVGVEEEGRSIGPAAHEKGLRFTQSDMEAITEILAEE